MAEWYTRQLEVLVLARDWRFKSSRPHHKRPDLRRVFCFVDDLFVLNFFCMKKPKIVVRVFETYLAVVENSIGSKSFQTLIATVDGKQMDLMQGGEFSCAFFVSSILKLFGLAKEVQATVSSTIADLEMSGWKTVKIPKKGDILVWEEKQFDDEAHRHIGFYMGDDMAISNSFKRKVPVKHHWMKEKDRRIELIFHYPKSMQSLLKK